MLCVIIIHPHPILILFFFFFNDTATTEIYTLSLHDALPICGRAGDRPGTRQDRRRPGVHREASGRGGLGPRSEEHTSELQSHVNLVCRLLLEKKKKNQQHTLTDDKKTKTKKE